MNTYKFLANAVLLIHVAYVWFVVVMLVLIPVGGLLKWSWVRNFWFRLVHFFMMAIVVVEFVFGVTCPLTTWEGQLREAGDTPPTPIVTGDGEEMFILKADDRFGSFLYYMLYFDYLPSIVFPILYFSIIALILLGFFLVPPRWPWRKPPPADVETPAVTGGP